MNYLKKVALCALGLMLFNVSVWGMEDTTIVIDNPYDALDWAPDELCRKLKIGSKSILSALFSPNGETVFIQVAYGEKAYLLNIKTKKILELATENSGGAFSPDSRTVALVTVPEKKICLYSVETGILFRKLEIEGFGCPLPPATFNFDGALIASASRNKEVCLWKVEAGKFLRKLEGHQGYITSIVFSSKGETIVTTENKAIRLWSTQTGKCIKQFHYSTLIQSVGFGSDDKTLIIVLGDLFSDLEYEVFLQNAETEECTKISNYPFGNSIFSHDNKIVFTSA